MVKRKGSSARNKTVSLRSTLSLSLNLESVMMRGAQMERVEAGGTF